MEFERKTLELSPYQCHFDEENRNPANIHLFKFSNRNSRERCEICSKLTIKTPEERHSRRPGVLLLTLNIFYTFFWCFCSLQFLLILVYIYFLLMCFE